VWGRPRGSQPSAWPRRTIALSPTLRIPERTHHECGRASFSALLTQRTHSGRTHLACPFVATARHRQRRRQQGRISCCNRGHFAVVAREALCPRGSAHTERDRQAWLTHRPPQPPQLAQLVVAVGGSFRATWRPPRRAQQLAHVNLRKRMRVQSALEQAPSSRT
jgi:hypothetical protein